MCTVVELDLGAGEHVLSSAHAQQMVENVVKIARLVHHTLCSIFHGRGVVVEQRVAQLVDDSHVHSFACRSMLKNDLRHIGR